MENATGIIIRLTKLTESSLIVHWCTEEHGLIKTVAKGARRPKSAFAGKVDLFFQADINWVRSRKSELHTLRELSVTDYREGLRRRYADTVVASYFGELLAHVVERDHPVPELFDLLQRGLRYLEESGADKKAVFHYEKELARLLGVGQGRTGAAMALEQAFGSLPRARAACLHAIGE